MPTAKVGNAYGVSVELTATEVSIGELGKQAMDLYREAVAVDTPRPGPAGFTSNERRWTPDHRDGGWRTGFEPVKAQEQ